MQTTRTATCLLKRGCQESFPADYRGVRRSTVSQELSIRHLWCFLGPSKDRLSVWQMRSQGPLAPCRLSRVTTLSGVTANGSLPKFWLYKAVVACSLTTCQVTVVVVELRLCFDWESDNKNSMGNLYNHYKQTCYIFLMCFPQQAATINKLIRHWKNSAWV